MTSSEKAFVERAAKDIIEIVAFTRWLGIGCIAAVLALVGNAIVLSVQDRIREHAVLQTLGFGRGLISRLIIAEGLLVGLAGGGLGTGAASLVLHLGQFSLTNEGLSIHFTTGTGVWVSGLGISMLLGIIAGLVPAWQASRREIAPSFRAV
jgi:putative ABC transport system permease protein